VPEKTETIVGSLRVKRGRHMLCLVAAFLFAGSVANAQTNGGTGRIAGVIHLAPAKPAPKFNAYPGRAHEQGAADENQPQAGGYSDVVVYLEPDPKLPATPRPTQRRAELTQSGMSFVPRVLPIMVKESVDFPNRDPFYHNVFSYSATKRFDLGRYSEGGNGSVTFPNPGEVRVFCDIHSDMNAVILVLSNRFFAQPDSSGRFEILDVPAGKHRLTVWHPDVEGKTIDVEVPDDAAHELEINL
jgi:plastocyanin